jgi:hypothetical protein
VPYPSFGAYTGYSVALNTAYAAAGLYSDEYRDLPITSYAWQIASTTGGPNAWWEANGSPPDPDNPWQGSHAAPEFGAIPYAWPMAGQTQTLLQSLVAQGLVSVKNPDSSVSYRTELYIGRGVPDAWIVPGQSISVGHLTSSYDESNGRRDTYGVRISVGRGQGAPLVTVSLTGDVPGNDVQIQLPAFADMGVTAVLGGRYDAATHTVTLSPGRGSAVIQLGNAARPSLAVQVASTVPGQHTQPTLTAGVGTAAGAGQGCSGRGGSGGRRLDGRSEVPGGVTAGFAASASIAIRTPVSSCGSRPAAWSSGDGTTSTSGSTPWFSTFQPYPSSQNA